MSIGMARRAAALCAGAWIMASVSSAPAADLSIFGSTVPGSAVTLQFRGLPGSPAGLFITAGFTEPGIVLPGGTFYLDLNSGWFFVPLPALDAQGTLLVPTVVPPNPLLLGATAQLQAFTPDVTNPLTVTIHLPDQQIAGSVPGAHLGGAVGSGDFDGDGLPDLALTEGGGPAVVQQVRLFRGPWMAPMGALLDPTPQAGAGFGSVVLVADLVGNTLADVVVGAPHAGSVTADDSGEVFVFDGATQQVAMHLTHPAGVLGTGFGTAIALGDFDGDGVPDLAASAPGTTVGGKTLAGEVHMFKGPGFNYWQTLQAPLPKQNGVFGGTLAAGDQDGDGVADLLVGSPGAPQGPVPGAGEAFLFHGPFGASPTQYLDPHPSPNAAFSCRVLLANLGGGTPLDVVIGTPGGGGSVDGNPTGIGSVGEVEVFTDGLGPARVLDDPTPEFFQHFGMDVKSGDVNGDGNTDLLVGAFLADRPGAVDGGEVFVYLGPSLNQRYELSASGAVGPAQFGVFLWGVDLDQDGDSEIVSCAPFDSPGGATQAGAAYVIRLH